MPSCTRFWSRFHFSSGGSDLICPNIIEALQRDRHGESGNGRSFDPAVEPPLDDLAVGGSHTVGHLLPAISSPEKLVYRQDVRTPFALQSVLNRVQQNLLLHAFGVLRRVR